MSRLLIFLILLLSNDSFSQVELFEDYKLCLMGIKNRQGEVLYEAQFRQINDYYIEDAKYYELVFDDDHIGIMDEQGKLLIPYEYNTIQILPDSTFTASNSENTTLYNFRDESKTAMDFDEVTSLTRTWNYSKRKKIEVFHKYPAYYLGKKDGLHYLLDSNFVQLNAQGFDSYEVKMLNHMPPIAPEELLFITIKDDKKGAMNHKGRVIVPCKYIHVSEHLVQKGDSFKLFYFVVDEKRKMGMYDDTGNIVVPIKYDNVRGESVPQNNEYSNTDLRFATILFEDTTSNTVDAYQLLSGKSKLGLEKAMTFGDHVIFEEHQRWGVMDDQLNVLSQGNKHVQSIHCGPFQGFPDEFSGNYWYYEETDNVAFIQPDYDVIYICEPFRKKIYFRNGRKYTDLNRAVKRGLLNFKTGKEIPIKYASISIRKTPNDICFWAVFPQKNENGAIKIDIYDRDFIKLKTLEIDPPEDEYSTLNEELANPWEIMEMTPFHQYFIDGMAGVVNYRGEVVIPFEHEKVNSIYLQKVRQNRRLNPNFLLTTDKNKIRLYYPDGKTAFQQPFDGVYQVDSNLLIKRNGVSTLYDASLQVIQDNISTHISLPALNDNGQEIRRENRSTIYRNYFIIDGFLYEWIDNKSILIDKNRIPFNGSAKVLFKRYLVDVDGRILENYTGEKGLKIFRGGYGKYRVNGSSLTISNNDGVKLHEFYNVTHQKQCGSILRLQAESTFIIYDLSTFTVVHRSDKIRTAYTMKNKLGKTTLLWMRAAKSNSYNLYNLDGNKIDSNYRYFTSRSRTITQKGDKFGLIDEIGRTLIPHEYDHIGYENAIYYLKKGQRWSIFNINSDSVEQPSFSDVSTAYSSDIFSLNPKLPVRSGNRYGLVDGNYDVLVPFTSEDSLIYHSDLFALFLGGKKLSDFGGFDSKGLDPLYRQLSNENILKKFKSLMTSQRIFLFSNSDEPKDHDCYTQKDIKTFSNNEFETEYNVEVSFTKNGYYSVEEVRSTYHIVERKKALESRFITHENYSIQNGQKILISLQDLFADANTYRENLNLVLLETFNEQQTFGLQCVTIEPVVSGANANFTIERGGIRVYNDGISRGSVLIPKEKLLPYLKDKTLFD